MRLGLLQLNPTIGAFAANREKLLAAYAQAVSRGAEFVLAPELFLCGYPPRDLLLREDFLEANLAALHETAEASAKSRCASATSKKPRTPGPRAEKRRRRPAKRKNRLAHGKMPAADLRRF